VAELTNQEVVLIILKMHYRPDYAQQRIANGVLTTYIDMEQLKFYFNSTNYSVFNKRNIGLRILSKYF